MTSYKTRYNIYLKSAYYGKLLGYPIASQLYEWALNAKKHIENKGVV